MGLVTVGMSGKIGGTIRALSDYCICVPSENTARVQEAHITVWHIPCSVIENYLNGAV